MVGLVLRSKIVQCKIKIYNISTVLISLHFVPRFLILVVWTAISSSKKCTHGLGGLIDPACVQYSKWTRWISA